MAAAALTANKENRAPGSGVGQGQSTFTPKVVILSESQPADDQ